MSNILHLPLKAHWYEMIESGVKTEEYRTSLTIGCNGFSFVATVSDLKGTRHWNIRFEKIC